MTPPSSGTEPTEPIVGLPRPQLLLDPAHRAHKAAVAAALFGQPEEVVRVGRFRVLDRLGEGGMGVVYAGHDDELDRRVAIKLLHSEHGHDPDARARLRREAQALARLSHPNVVQIFEVGDHHGQRFVAMEFVAGQTLHTWLRAGPPRPWRAVLAVLIAAGHGLAAAHAVGLVHRDFKPGNVMLAADGRARVLDFGLARSQGDDQAALPATLPLPSPLTAPLTMTGGVLGTPAYMAPEQFLGQRCDARSDQFSFCVTLFEALHGQRPFTGPTALAIYNAIDRQQIAAPPAGSPVPAWLHAVVLRGLSRDPAARWPTMAALLHELTRDRDAQRRRRRLTAGVAAITTLALTLASTLGLASLREHRREAACLAEGAQISGVWNPIVRARLLAAAAPASAAQRSDLANELDHLDASAAHWRRLRGDACRDPVASTTTLRFMQQRVERCFDEARDNLRTSIAVLADTGAHELPFATRFDNRDIERCRDDSWLATDGSAYPDDPALRRRWQAVRAELERSGLALHEGRALEARARAHEALTGAAPLAAPALTLAALRSLYTAQFAAGERLPALASFESALALAPRVVRATLAGGSEAVNVELLLGAAGGVPREDLASRLASPATRTPLDATRHLAEALAAATPQLWRTTILTRWWVFGTQYVRSIAASAEAFAGLGDFPTAEDFARNGLTILAAAPRPDPHLEITLLTALARATTGLGQLERASAALRRVSELARDCHDLPPARHAWALLARAELDLAQADLASAARSLNHAESQAAAAATADDRLAPALELGFAALHARRGEPEQAAQRLTRARGLLAASHGVTRALWVAGELQRVRLDLAAGRLDDASERLAEALRIHSELVGPDHVSLIPILTLKGQLERTRGELVASRTTLARARTLSAANTVGWPTRRELDQQLALSAAASEPASSSLPGAR